MNKNMSKTLAAIFLVTLTLLILWPLLAATGIVGANRENYENRRLAKFPNQIASIEDFVKWPRRMDDFFGDHLPNRGNLLGLNAWIRYHIFRTSPVQNVLVGKDGWLFHGLWSDLLEVEGRLARAPYQIRRLRIVLEERQDWLAEQGIDYMVLVAPTKQTVYPDKLPAWLKPSTSRPSRRELLIEELQHSGSGVTLFDFTPALRKAKANRRDALYYRHDSHWNYLGALEAYAALAERYPEWFSMPGEDWISKKMPRESNLMRMMGLPGEEVTPYPQPAGGFAARSFAPDTITLKQMAMRGSVAVYRRPNAKAAKLYLLADSFAGWNSAYLAENFSRTVLTNTWGNQWKRIEQFPYRNILAEKPELVIEQMVENRLDAGVARNLLADVAGNNHPAEVRDARLRRLARSAGEGVAEFRHTGKLVEIQKPAGSRDRAFIVTLDLELAEGGRASIAGISPFPEKTRWDDLCLRGGEMTERMVRLGRSEVRLCVPAAADNHPLRVRLNAVGEIRVMGVRVARHPDVEMVGGLNLSSGGKKNG